MKIKSTTTEYYYDGKEVIPNILNKPVAIPTTKSEKKALKIKYSAIDDSNNISVWSLMKADAPFYMGGRSKECLNVKLVQKLFPEVLEALKTDWEEDWSPIPSNLKFLAVLKEVKGGEIKAAKWRRRHNVKRYNIDNYVDYYVRTKR